MGRLQEWWDQRAVKTHVGEIQALPANKLRERLPSYLGFDLCRAMAAPDAPRIVLMIDAYKALWRDTHRGALQNLRVDSWVRTLVEHAPGVLLTIFCRDKLRWDELNDKWKVLLEQHLLGGLSNVDAVRFLTRAGISLCRGPRTHRHGRAGSALLSRPGTRSVRSPQNEGSRAGARRLRRNTRRSARAFPRPLVRCRSRRLADGFVPPKRSTSDSWGSCVGTFTSDGLTGRDSRNGAM